MKGMNNPSLKLKLIQQEEMWRKKGISFGF
jgi:hypothetical protein